MVEKTPEMAEKLTINQKKEWAKLLYTKDAGITQKEIAVKVEVSEKTIGNWVKDGGWEQMRQSLLLSRDEQLRNLNEQWNELNRAIKKKPAGERFPDSKEADILSKLSNAIKNLETEVNLTGAMDAGKGFIHYVRQADFASIQLCTRLYDGYIKSLIK